MSSSRETILKALKKDDNIDNILNGHFSLENIFIQPTSELSQVFKKQLDSISGKCIIFENENLAIKYLIAAVEDMDSNIVCNNRKIIDLIRKNNISNSVNTSVFYDNLKVSITACEAIVARTGSVIVSSENDGRKLYSASEIHFVLAYSNQLFNDFDTALSNLKQKYGNSFPSQFTVITGPSRTADIEKTLILGAHGPKQLIVLLVNN